MKQIFIGGTGRSGTSILKRLIACHPSVASLQGELRLIVDPGGALDLATKLSVQWSPYDGDSAIKQFRRIVKLAEHTSLPERAFRRVLLRIGMSPRRYSGMNLGEQFGRKNYKQVFDKLFDQLQSNTSRGSWVGSPSFQLSSMIDESQPWNESEVSQLIGQYFDQLFAYRLPRGTHWVDDTPFNLLHYDRLAKMFPTLKLVHIYRDPRDVVASYLTKRWGGTDAHVVAHRINSILQQWLMLRSTLPHVQLLEVSLEKLASAPFEMGKQIYEFLELDEYVSMEQDCKELIKKDMVNIGRWKTIASFEDLSLHSLLEPSLSAYGCK